MRRLSRWVVDMLVVAGGLVIGFRAGPWLWVAVAVATPLLALALALRPEGRGERRRFDPVVLAACVVALLAVLLLWGSPFLTKGHASASWAKVPVREAAGAALCLLTAALALAGLGLRPRPGVGPVLVAYGLALFIFLAWPFYEQDRQNAKLQTCLGHMATISQALLMYAADQGDRLPPAKGWEDLMKPYVHEAGAFSCPDARNQRSSYAYNARIAGRKIEEIGALYDAPLLLESDGGWNASGGPELLPAKPRHRRVDAYGFADGHARPVLRVGRPGKPWEVKPAR